jgi:branched-chain amino acid transport system permease protein
LALVVPAAFAALLGLWSFWGRLSDVYFGVVTLTVTLILYKLMVGASGPAWRIGSAHLGGYNGIPGLPALHWPGQAPFDPIDLFRVALVSLAMVYLSLRLVLASRFGRVLVAVRENPLRASLLGYDPRLYRLGALVLGGAIAGHAGMLYANWGAFVSPEMFSLATTVQVIAWVLIGGRASLPGAVLGCVGLQVLQARLGAQQLLDTNLILGGLLVLFVLLVPAGLVPTLRAWSARLRRP